MDAADAWVEAGRFESARSVAERIDSTDYRKAYSYIKIARAELEHGDHESVRETLALALSAAADTEDSRYKDFVHRDIGRVRLAVGDCEGAAAALERIRDAGILEYAWVFFARTLAEMGDIEAAKDTAERIGRSRERAMAYARIAEAQAESGDFNAAMNTASVADVRWRGRAHALIAAARLRADDIEGARQALARALVDAEQDDSLVRRLDSYHRIARLYVQSGDRDSGRRVLKQAIDAASRIDDVQRRASSYRSIGMAQIEVGDFDSARRTLIAASTIADDIKHPWMRSIALRDIALAFLEMGDLDGAESVAAKIDGRISDGTRETAYERIGMMKAEQGDFGGAIAVLACIGEVRGMHTAHEGIARSMARAGGIAELSEWVGTISDYRSRAYAMVGVARGLMDRDSERERD